jgi:hypothetical protein
MLIGYLRVSSTDERQSVDLQRDALVTAGVDERHLHQDKALGARDDRPGSRPASPTDDFQLTQLLGRDVEQHVLAIGVIVGERPREAAHGGSELALRSAVLLWTNMKRILLW